MNRTLKLLNSITDADASTVDALVVSGSHGGLYPAAVASQAGAHAVIFNDAGIGLDGAGIAGVKALAGCGMAAAAASCMSCRIGSADDMMAHGIISYVNSVAVEYGVKIHMPVSQAVDILRQTAEPAKLLDPAREARWEEEIAGLDTPVLFVDSASLVKPQDAGRVIITGSHGGLIGGDPIRALKARAHVAVFNDAGFGKDKTGISRLAALDQTGVAALTVSHETAHIGQARSCIETGVISAINKRATELGFETGKRLRSSTILFQLH